MFFTKKKKFSKNSGCNIDCDFWMKPTTMIESGGVFFPIGMRKGITKIMNELLQLIQINIRKKKESYIKNRPSEESTKGNQINKKSYKKKLKKEIFEKNLWDSKYPNNVTIQGVSALYLAVKTR